MIRSSHIQLIGTYVYIQMDVWIDIATRFWPPSFSLVFCWRAGFGRCDDTGLIGRTGLMTIYCCSRKGQKKAGTLFGASDGIIEIKKGICTHPPTHPRLPTTTTTTNIVYQVSWYLVSIRSCTGRAFSLFSRHKGTIISVLRSLSFISRLTKKCLCFTLL